MNTLRKSVTHLLASRISSVVSPMTSVFMITLSPNTSQLISIGAVIGGIVLYFAAPKLAGVGNVAEEKSVG